MKQRLRWIKRALKSQEEKFQLLLPAYTLSLQLQGLGIQQEQQHLRLFKIVKTKNPPYTLASPIQWRLKTA